MNISNSSNVTPFIPIEKCVKFDDAELMIEDD